MVMITKQVITSVCALMPTAAIQPDTVTHNRDPTGGTGRSWCDDHSIKWLQIGSNARLGTLVPVCVKSNLDHVTSC